MWEFCPVSPQYTNINNTVSYSFIHLWTDHCVLHQTKITIYFLSTNGSSGFFKWTFPDLTAHRFFVLFFSFHLFSFRLSWFNQFLNCALNPCTFLFLSSPFPSSICSMFVQLSLVTSARMPPILAKNRKNTHTLNNSVSLSYIQ